MTRVALPAVRGRRAAIFSRDRKAVASLTRHLDMLDVSVVLNPDQKARDADVCILDVDTYADNEGPSLDLHRAPVVALVGTETPGRLAWMMAHEPASFLMKPLGSHGIFTALVVALCEARRREQEFLKMLRLEERIRARRIVVAAIIKLMRVYGIEEPEAFGMLRNAAQQRRITIESLCAEVAGDLFLPVRLAASR